MKKKIFCLILSLLLLCPALVFRVSAASAAKASLSFSSSKVTVGDKVTVTVQYQSSAEIGSYYFLLNYDASVFQYESGSDSETGNGTIRFVNYNENSDLKVVKRTVVFKAIATGSGKFSTQATDIIANSDFSRMSVTEASGSVTVNPVQTASSNNNLKSLTVSGGKFSPEFSASQTKYSMEVDFSVKKLVVSAVAEDSKAKVSISGTDLDLGENSIKITVTAENGSKKTYTLTVTRKESQLANVTAVVEGNTYLFAHDPDSLTPPEGFTAGNAAYGEHQVLCYTDEDGFFTLVWLTPVDPPESAPASSSSAPAPSSVPASTQAQTSENPAETLPDSSLVPPREGWYMLLSDGTLLPYMSLTPTPADYVPIPLPEDGVLPDGCESVYVTIGGENVRAYRNEYCVNNNLYLIYARCSDKSTGLFYWHEPSGCFYPYFRPETVTITLTMPAESSDDSAEVNATLKPGETSANAGNRELILWIFSATVTVLFVILLIVFIAMMRKNQKANARRARTRRRISRDPAAHFAKESTPKSNLLLPTQPEAEPAPQPAEEAKAESAEGKEEESESDSAEESRPTAEQSGTAAENPGEGDTSAEETP